jgi:micrococcal nuclease
MATSPGARSYGIVLAAFALVIVGVLVVAVLSRSGSSGDGAGTGATGADDPASSGPTVLEANATVVRAVDGDTLVVAIDGDDERLRLIGIDTPESVAEDRPDECYGHEASEHLAELLPAGTPIRSERDVEPRDHYDRLLGYAYRAGDGVFVNEALVAGGYAEAKEFPPNTTLHDRLEAAEAAARSGQVGLWGACGSPDVTLPTGRFRG